MDSSREQTITEQLQALKKIEAAVTASAAFKKAPKTLSKKQSKEPIPPVVTQEIVEGSFFRLEAMIGVNNSSIVERYCNVLIEDLEQLSKQTVKKANKDALDKTIQDVKKQIDATLINLFPETYIGSAHQAETQKTESSIGDIYGDIEAEAKVKAVEDAKFIDGLSEVIEGTIENLEAKRVERAVEADNARLKEIESLLSNPPEPSQLLKELEAEIKAEAAAAKLAENTSHRTPRARSNAKGEPKKPQTEDQAGAQQPRARSDAAAPTPMKSGRSFLIGAGRKVASAVPASGAEAGVKAGAEAAKTPEQSSDKTPDPKKGVIIGRGRPSPSRPG